MPRGVPTSPRVKRNILKALEAGATITEVAARRGIAASAIGRWRRMAADGQVKPAKAKSRGITHDSVLWLETAGKALESRTAGSLSEPELAALMAYRALHRRARA